MEGQPLTAGSSCCLARASSSSSDSEATASSRAPPPLAFLLPPRQVLLSPRAASSTWLCLYDCFSGAISRLIQWSRTVATRNDLAPEKRIRNPETLPRVSLSPRCRATVRFGHHHIAATMSLICHSALPRWGPNSMTRRWRVTASSTHYPSSPKLCLTSKLTVGPLPARCNEAPVLAQTRRLCFSVKFLTSTAALKVIFS